MWPKFKLPIQWSPTEISHLAITRKSTHPLYFDYYMRIQLNYFYDQTDAVANMGYITTNAIVSPVVLFLPVISQCSKRLTCQLDYIHTTWSKSYPPSCYRPRFYSMSFQYYGRIHSTRYPYPFMHSSVKSSHPLFLSLEVKPVPSFKRKYSNRFNNWTKVLRKPRCLHKSSFQCVLCYPTSIFIVRLPDWCIVLAFLWTIWISESLLFATRIITMMLVTRRRYSPIV